MCLRMCKSVCQKSTIPAAHSKKQGVTHIQLNRSFSSCRLRGRTLLGMQSSVAGDHVVGQVERWCCEITNREVRLPLRVEPDSDGSCRYVVTTDARKHDELIRIPGDAVITLADVNDDPELKDICSERSEVVSLALFVSKQRYMGEESTWHVLLSTMPTSVDSPVFWEDEDRDRLLKGSPVLDESRIRGLELEKEWESLVESVKETPSWFSKQSFMESMSVVLSHATFLPKAQCFALVPILGGFPKTGGLRGCIVDYNVDENAVTVVASATYTAGDEIKVYDGRSNGELLMATGAVEAYNPSDYLTLNASLVAADRLYSMKEEIASAMGLSASMEFPIYEDRLATQHLAFLRMARITDPALFAKVSFEEDSIVSQENEYEVLQLIMADARELLQGYSTGIEDDMKELQREDLTRRERVSAMLRLGEKRILRGTMDGVRRRLAPIRGIPTKSGGLEDPNADLIEIFETIESIPMAPKKLWESFSSWARGDNDPDFPSRGR